MSVKERRKFSGMSQRTLFDLTQDGLVIGRKLERIYPGFDTYTFVKDVRTELQGHTIYYAAKAIGRVLLHHLPENNVSALPTGRTRIMSQGRALGVPASVRYITPELTGNEIAIIGDVAEGAVSFPNWSCLADTPGNQAFVENYRATYSIELNQWGAQSYTALYIIAVMIVNAGTTEAAAVRRALANIADSDTILGSFSFNVEVMWFMTR